VGGMYILAIKIFRILTNIQCMYIYRCQGPVAAAEVYPPPTRVVSCWRHDSLMSMQASTSIKVYISIFKTMDHRGRSTGLLITRDH
jgi:hypothetical protein